MPSAKPAPDIKPLRGIRILSLALNIPGPAALMRLRAMGATCTKVDPPSGDPMYQYSRAVYETLHQGVKVVSADLRNAAGQKTVDISAGDAAVRGDRPIDARVVEARERRRECRPRRLADMHFIAFKGGVARHKAPARGLENLFRREDGFEVQVSQSGGGSGRAFDPVRIRDARAEHLQAAANAQDTAAPAQVPGDIHVPPLLP